MQRDVLIIDGDRDLGRSLVVMLEENGYRAVAVQDETEARRVLVGARPCLILVGALAPVRMRAVLKFIRTQLRKVPAVIMSHEAAAREGGASSSSSSSSSSSLPAVDRPADPDALMQVVHRFCAPRRDRAAAVN
jgi:DNA-binding NtrC family response regulator